MNTEKKNQHYIPKFYLRNFSINGKGKQIGIFNVHNDFFFPMAPLKTQGSKNFFYGYDGVVEDRLSNIEGFLSSVIRGILTNKILPQKNSTEYIDLLAFVGLTHLRNPVIIENIKNSTAIMKERILEIDSKSDVENIIPLVSHDEAIDVAISNLRLIIENIRDLNVKLLINKSRVPFITSDFPIVRYNQFLEERKWMHGKTGFGNTGLQIYIPLDNEIALFFYDSEVYKVGFNKWNYFEITNVSDINQLNTLQILYCLDTVFFNEFTSEFYIRTLFENSKKFKRANKQKSSVHKFYKTEGETSQLVIIGTTNSDIKLKIAGINKNSRANGIKLHPSIAQLRKGPSEIWKKRHQY